MEFWVATTNKGKLREFEILVADLSPTIKSVADLPVYSPPPETGDSFVANARIKAKAMKAIRPEKWIFGEDSGLEVDALGNLPGIHSARYAGPKASDAENNSKLIKMLQVRQVSDRKARFRCALVVYTPEGEEWVFEGTIEGTIAKTLKGTAGFGYDVLFIPEGENKTLAELGLAYKNKHSHRADAIRAFKAKYLETRA